MRRRVLVPLAAVLAAGVLVLGTSAVTGASVGDKKLKKCDAKTATKGVAKALHTFLTAKTGALKVALVDLQPDQVAAYAKAIGDSDAAATAAGVALPVDAAKVKAKCKGKNKAGFTYDLVNSETGDPLLAGQAGDAVLKKGKWLLDATYPCDLTDQNPVAAAASTECYNAIGQEDPTP